MGAVYNNRHQAATAAAKIIVRKGQRLAQWQDVKGKARTSPVTVGKDGADRIVVTARTYTAKYRDGSGIVQEVATGCRDESAARAVLNELEKRADKVRSGIRTVAEDAVIDHQATPLGRSYRRLHRPPEGQRGLPVVSMTFAGNCAGSPPIVDSADWPT